MSRLETMLQPFEAAKEWTEPRIAEGIENRKADAVVEVVDASGAPVSDVKVTYNLKRHAFLHGANCFMLDELETAEKNQKYKELFAKAFNEATLPFYWNDLEPEQGKPRFAKDSPKVYRRPAPDLCLEYCEQNNAIPKLHCLNYDQWTPVWVNPHNVDEVKFYLEKRIKEIAERYADKIPGMEVINETLCGWARPMFGRTSQSTDFFAENDIISWSFDTARKYLPKTELIINEATRFAWDTDRNERSWYALSIADAIRRGADIDTIGLQYHMFHKLEDEVEKTLPYYEPKKLFNAMDFYADTFKKPLQVTEITIPAYSDSAEDEELQAKIIENLYSIWFSHPAMEAAIYWNLVDGYAAFAPQGDMTVGENYYYGGLVRFDFTPKPAYYMMQELFQHRWHTEGSVSTDLSGKVSFRGFKGDYEVTLEKNGQIVKHTCTLDGNAVKLVLA